MSIISVKNLTKSYKNHHVLQDVSFEVEKGKVYALLGSNGAGKTTIINILSTLLSYDGGTVSVAGHDVATAAKEIRKNISLTGQFAAIDDLLTARENMHMLGQLSRAPIATVRERTEQLLAQFNLQKAADKRVSTYSGGMRRKLDLAVSLLSSPSVIFLDEPTTGLDPRSRQELWRIIRELAQSGTTILLTTQYLDEADSLADRVGVLNAGKIVAEGTAAELKDDVGAEYVDLTFQNTADQQKAQALLEKSVAQEGSELILSVPLVHQFNEIRTLLNNLAEASIEPKSLNMRKATLDDVFMKLTDDSSAQKEAK